ncbi:hypothetical protein BJ508DRAFT_413239 [Ascobolus immersus RN42]|uniref:Maintenance of mitochondrial morphology protein 1 n=1 Tax=Ascobolus immersus RN42 TaxID=1160509 RepID=A0A3N4IDL4_ASCIM|nr:hypothetical protein BJ508DRAFT_413239 [Ascobolus immersus RN42]
MNPQQDALQNIRNPLDMANKGHPAANAPQNYNPYAHAPPVQPVYIAPTCPAPPSSWSFAQGLLLGQLSVLLVLTFFIRFFIFGEPPDDRRNLRGSKHKHTHHRHNHHAPNTTDSTSSDPNQLRKKRSSVLRNPPPLTTATILTKTYYNVNSHQPESLDWFNVLIAQTIAQFREEARRDDALLKSLDDLLNNSGKKPDFLDRIKVTEVSLGEEFPIFSNCRISRVVDPSGGSEGKLQATMDVDLSDILTLGVETRLLLNYPKPLTAALPVALAVSIVRFSGTLSISFTPPSSSTTASSTAGSSTSSANAQPQQQKATTLSFAFSQDYHLDIQVRSLIGSRSRLQDIPKIAQLVESKFHSWFDERCVEPKFQEVVLPSLWPRKKTTREAGSGGPTVVGVGATASGSGSGTTARDDGLLGADLRRRDV